MAVAFNGKHLAKFIRPEEYEAIYPQVELAHKQLETKTGFGNDFLGWLDLPVTYDKEEFARIKEAAQKIRSDSDVLLVAGIGGLSVSFGKITLTAVATALILGIIVNAILSNKKEKSDSTAEDIKNMPSEDKKKKK